MEGKKQALIDWVTDKNANNVKQGDDEWHNRKRVTIGGSSIATIINANPYSNIYSFVRQRIANEKIDNDAVHWGNLFEPIIKEYVESVLSCDILGENIYVQCDKYDGYNEYISYSPDGLGIVNRNSVPTNVLFEFKCPFTRIPTDKPPVYYVPQVKMGMDVLKLPEVGALIEGYFRRCSWDDLGLNNKYNNDLDKAPPKKPLDSVKCMGYIGFTFTSRDSLVDDIYKDAGTEDVIDLGKIHPSLFARLIRSKNIVMVNSILIPCYKSSRELLSNNDYYKEMAVTDDEIDMILEGESPKIEKLFGILPWKLFNIKYHVINKEEDYLRPHLDKIKNTINTIIKLTDKDNESSKENIYDEFISSNGGGFSDGL